MVSLAGHVIEDRFLNSLTTGPSSDLQYATLAAQDYVGALAMGPTKLVLAMQPGQMPPGPIMVAAHELLDQLYEETERLLREKEPAVHTLAKALLDRDELIGEELDEVFDAVEAAHPELLRPFERKLIQFRSFAPRDPQAGDAWMQAQAAPAAAATQPAASAADWRPPVASPAKPEADLSWAAGHVPAPAAVESSWPGRHETYTS